MKVFKSIILLFCSLMAVGQDIPENAISGQLALSSKWEPVIYLSYIPNMNERLTMSSEMFIDQARIDPSGHFSFSTQFLSEQEGMYRIHITKRGHPKSSLIIGGRDQNFQFLIAKKNAQVQITSSDTSSPFQTISLNGYWPNAQLALVDRWTHFTDSASFAGTGLKKELIENAMDEKMRQLADTTSNVVAGLYAIYNGHFEKNRMLYDEFYERFSDRWHENKSDPFIEFSRAYLRPVERPSYKIVWVGIICFGFGLCIPLLILWLKSKKRLNPLQELSVQERKIYELLVKGQSNKEISENCNIGVNTVKSHVSSIYSKLNVKSRKDILNLSKPL